MLRMFKCKRGEERGFVLGQETKGFWNFLAKTLEEKVTKLKKSDIPDITVVEDSDKYIIFYDTKAGKSIIDGKPRLSGTPLAALYNKPISENGQRINVELYEHKSTEITNDVVNLLDL
jgi:hypothetical protein